MQDHLLDGYVKALNRHGFAFQYAVLKEVKRLYGRGKSRFEIEASEVPVELQGMSTRIDFVLRHISMPIVIVGECKRVNPALNNWCFVRAPYIHRERRREYIFAEHLYRAPDATVSTEAINYCSVEHAFHIAFEVSSSEKGDAGGGSGRSAIEEAATQVCRGLNGLAERFRRDGLRGIKAGRLILLPVIFTTAQLWTSSADLSATDLKSGNLHRDRARLNEASWLAYQYHLSPGIKHSGQSSLLSLNIAEVMDRDHIRTVVVVSPQGIGDMLEALSRFLPA